MNDIYEFIYSSYFLQQNTTKKNIAKKNKSSIEIKTFKTNLKFA